MIHSFLLIGQSNMAGRGFIAEAEHIENENLLVLRNGRWQPLYRPVNCDRPFSGVCLAESFAAMYTKEKGVMTGLIPCADGGTALEQWKEGSLLFDNAVYQARLAARTSTVAGVLWHQGEADCSESLYPIYEEKLSAMIAALRRKLQLWDVPFILGGLGDFLSEFADSTNLRNYKKVNEALRHYAENNDMTGFVSAEGLTSNPDKLHFNTKYLIEFGKRYYEVFKKCEDPNKIFIEKENTDFAERSKMERL